MEQLLVDGLYPVIRAEQMHRSIIVQLFGLMCQDCPENGSNLFGQIHSELHSQSVAILAQAVSAQVGWSEHLL